MKFKPYIDSIFPYVPGKPIDELKRELGLDDVVKLASNENPLGYSPKAKKAIADNIDKFYLYPDGGVVKLKSKLSEFLSVPPEKIIITNGSNEVIELIGKGFLDAGDEVLSSKYSFLVYPLVAKLCGAEYVESPDLNFAYNLADMASYITGRTKVIFLANPNNPTGTIFRKGEFEEFMDKVGGDIVVCLDEAYFDFVDDDFFPNGIDYINSYDNLVVIRTFSKAFGLAGFRVGYGVGNEKVIEYLNKIRQPFNVNALAQTAAYASLEDTEFIESTKELVRDEKKYLYSELDRLGFSYIPSETNFILINIKSDGKEFFNYALKKGVIVRDMNAYGLPAFIRITIGKHTENIKFVKLLEDLKGE